MSTSADKTRLPIRASASRLDKGLLAVPQRFKNWFPSTRAQIQVAFDDEKETKALTFHPYDPAVKESRIFGLGGWFARRGVREGDLISIILEEPDRGFYRIVLDRYVRELEEQESRYRLEASVTDSDADNELSVLSRLTRKRQRRVAQEELARIAQESVRRPRPRVRAGAVERHEGVPAGIRVLLRELHKGKCQVCSFTFEKKNGEPYFEIHHLDPEIGHHPTNLLIVCANCHAQFEHATVTKFEWAGNWLVGVTINGRRAAVRQQLAHKSIKRRLFVLFLLVLATQLSRLLVR